MVEEKEVLNIEGFWRIVNEEILYVVKVIEDNEFCYEEFEIIGQALRDICKGSSIFRESDGSYTIHMCNSGMINEWIICF